MTSKWETVKLGDICQASRNRVDPRLMDPTEKLVHYSIPILDATGLPEIVQAKTIQSHKFRITDDSVLVSMLNPRIPRVFNAYGAENSVGSTEFSVLSPIGDSDISLNFLYLLCSSKALWEYLESVATGSTGSRKRAKTQNLLDYEVSLPPLAEQRRIVDLIGALDDAIEAAELKVESCLDVESHFRTSVMAPAYSSKTVPLGEVASSRLGKMLSATTATNEPLAPYVRNANVQWGELLLDDLKEMPFSDADRVEFSLLKDDVLICEGGEIGRTVVLKEDLPDVFFQKAIHRVRCSDSLDPHYLSMCMQHMAVDGTLELFSGALTIPHLTGQKLRKLPIPVIPIEEQRLIVETMSAISGAKQEQKEHLESLRSLRSELLTALLTGAHEIPESYDTVMELADA